LGASPILIKHRESNMNRRTQRGEGSLAMVGMLAIFLGGMYWLWLGFAGIRVEFGGWWSLAALIAAFVFRFTLPLTVGVFFYVRDVWELHWLAALVVAAPGLLLMLPAVFSLIAEGFGRLRGNR
jgi:hypothetical protein